MKRVLVLGSIWILSVAVAPADLSAQWPGALSLGDEILVSWFDGGWGTQISAYSGVRSRTLEFVSLSPLQLVGRDGDQLYVIETSSLRALRRRIGTKPASAPAMVLGSAAGFAAAFVIGAAHAAGKGGNAVNRGLSSGVLIGAPLGALVAWISSRSRGIYEDVHISGRRRR